MPVGKIKRSVIDFIRDGFGLVVTGALGYSIPGIGGIIGYLVSPHIASTSEGKSFNRMFAVLVTFDSILEVLTKGRGVI
jgi:hypothetical protein